MTKTNHLSDGAAVTLRKIVGIISIVLTGLIILFMCIGIFPIFKQNSDIITVAINTLEVLKVTSKPILPCMLETGFSILYFVLLIICLLEQGLHLNPS